MRDGQDGMARRLIRRGRDGGRQKFPAYPCFTNCGGPEVGLSG